MKLLNLACLSLASLSLTWRADAEFVSIYPGPAYDSGSKTGYMNPSFWQYHGPVVANGVAIVGAGSYTNGVLNGSAAFRWGQAQALEELGNLGNSGTGSFHAYPTAINSSGLISGFSEKYVNGVFKGERAVKWIPGSSQAVELPTLGTTSTGYARSLAFAINDAGIAAGGGDNYIPPVQPAVWWAIRWSADGIPAKLGSLAHSELGQINDSVACAINGSGSAVGCSRKEFSGGLVWRAARWNASGTEITELADVSTSTSGVSLAWGINDSNVTVGLSDKYELGAFKGKTTVRWSADGNATELGNLGTLSSTSVQTNPPAINNAGVISGVSTKYVAGVNLGIRAVRWNPDSIDAIELSNLGTSSAGYAKTQAWAINQASIIAGDAEAYDSSGALLGARAVVWREDGTAIVLNNLIDPTSGWVNLTSALGISNGNWVMGNGTFDADGAGSLEPYKRAFLLHVDLYTPGDANGDDAVDSVDFTTFVSNFGTLDAATWGMGDFDGDEKVTTSDFNRLAGHFGESAPMTGTVVPEPVSMLLAAILFVQRRHRSAARAQQELNYAAHETSQGETQGGAEG